MTPISDQILLETPTSYSAHAGFFPEEEYTERLARLREKMKQDQLSACLVTTPENILYYTGLNHWGFFGLHLLIIPLEGKMTLVTRAMERVTIENQLGPRVNFEGYKDQEIPAEFAAQVVKNSGIGKGRVGIDLNTLYRSYADTKSLLDALPEAEAVHLDHFMNGLRLAKSPREIEAVRKAAAISVEMTQAAIKATHPGVTEKTISAEVHRAMIEADGEPPSFGPFLRPTRRLGEEHTTWAQGTIEKGDILFTECSGSYDRYHAPMGRLVFVNDVPKGTEAARDVCLAAFEAVTKTLKPGAIAHDVYRSWQDVVDNAGLEDYQRHHCGYMVGTSFPPSWMEGINRFVSLRKGSDLVIQQGMVFHVMSWLMGSRAGDYFVSNTVAVTSDGCEVLTNMSNDLIVV